MSFGWVNPKAGVPGAGGRGAAVMRGPMVAKVSENEARARRTVARGRLWGDLPVGSLPIVGDGPSVVRGWSEVCCAAS